MIKRLGKGRLGKSLAAFTITVTTLTACTFDDFLEVLLEAAAVISEGQIRFELGGGTGAGDGDVQASRFDANDPSYKVTDDNLAAVLRDSSAVAATATTFGLYGPFLETENSVQDVQFALDPATEVDLSKSLPPGLDPTGKTESCYAAGGLAGIGKRWCVNVDRKVPASDGASSAALDLRFFKDVTKGGDLFTPIGKLIIDGSGQGKTPIKINIKGTALAIGERGNWQGAVRGGAAGPVPGGDVTGTLNWTATTAADKGRALEFRPKPGETYWEVPVSGSVGPLVGAKTVTMTYEVTLEYANSAPLLLTVTAYVDN